MVRCSITVVLAQAIGVYSTTGTGVVLSLESVQCDHRCLSETKGLFSVYCTPTERKEPEVVLLAHTESQRDKLNEVQSLAT